MVKTFDFLHNDFVLHHLKCQLPEGVVDERIKCLLPLGIDGLRNGTRLEELVVALLEDRIREMCKIMDRTLDLIFFLFLISIAFVRLIFTVKI